MPIVIQCPKCAKRYQVADGHAGKQVRCQQCQTPFVAAAPPAAEVDLFGSNEPLAERDFSQLPGADLRGVPTANAPGSYFPTAARAARPRVSNPSGGPTDARMRLVCGGMLAFGMVIILGSVVAASLTGSVYLFVVGLAPLMLVLGIAGLISPNVVRGMGQFGGHLPQHYKFIGWAVMGSSVLITILVMFGLLAAGFQSGVPRRRPRVRNVAPTTTAPPSTAKLQPKHNQGSGTREGGNAKKPLKSYPVTIAVPPGSQFVPADARLQPGTRLEACWSGKWNPITFLSENDDGTLTVRWDDFGPAFDCGMIREELIIKTDVLR